MAARRLFVAPQTVSAKIADPNLAAFLGKTTVPIDFPKMTGAISLHWGLMSDVEAGAEVLVSTMRADTCKTTSCTATGMAAYNIPLAASVKVPGGGRVDISLSRRRACPPGGVEAEFLSPAQVLDKYPLLDGRGVAKGIDFLLQKKFGRFNGWIGYTIGEVRHHFDAYGDYDFYAAHDVTHEFKVVGLYKWRNWDFSATWIYATGKPYTAPEGAYTVSLLDGTTRDFLNVSAKNAYRLPDYHRLDVAATYHFQFLGSAPASLNFSIFNLYARKNVWYKQFEVIDNQLIEANVNYLGFTPNLTFSVKIR